MANSDIQIKIEALNNATAGLLAVSKDLKGISKDTVKASKGMESFDLSLKKIAATGGIALGLKEIIQGIVNFGKEAFNTSLKVERIIKPIEAIEQANAPVVLKYLHDEADRLGQNFYDLATAWSQMDAAAKGTVMQGEPLRRIFQGINEAAVTLSKSGSDVQGMFYAITQMMSKGMVSAEELRRQLGERLPGTFQLAADSMGVTTAQLDKMLERGELLAVDLLPRLGDALHEKYGKAAVESASKSQKAVNKFDEAWTDLKNNLIDSDLAVGGINAVTAAVKGLNDTIRDMPSWEHVENALENVPEQLAKINAELEKINRNDPEARRRASLRKSFARNIPGSSPYGQTGVTDSLEAQKQYYEDIADLLYAVRRSLSAMTLSNTPAEIVPEENQNSQKYLSALAAVREQLSLIGKTGAERELAQLNLEFEKQAKALGANNAELIKLRDAKAAAIREKWDSKAAEEELDLTKRIERATLERFEVQRREARRTYAELRTEAESKGWDTSGIDAGLVRTLKEISAAEKEAAEGPGRELREELARIGLEGRRLAQVKLDQWMERLKRETGAVTPEMQALYDAQQKLIDEQYKWDDSGVLGGLGKGFEDFSTNGKTTFESLADAAEDAGDSITDSLNDALWDADATWDNVFKSWMMDLTRMAIRENITKPIFSGLSSFLGFVQHEGGPVGSGPARLVPEATFNGARRYHSGGSVLGTGEVPIIAKAGEIVLNAAQQANVAEGLGNSKAAPVIVQLYGQDGRKLLETSAMPQSSGGALVSKQDVAILFMQAANENTAGLTNFLKSGGF